MKTRATDSRSYPLVSIISPTYNHERYISECIESVLAQTYPNWEQIIIDDGSSDDTAAVVSRFSDQRIRYIHQNNIGVFRLSETYNRALHVSHGDLIAVLEGDDLWPADRLAALVPAFADAEVIVSYGVCLGFNHYGGPVPFVIPSDPMKKVYGPGGLGNIPVGAISYAMLRSGTMVASANGAMIRRTALEEIGGFQHRPGLPLVDYPTLLELGLKGKFCFVDRVACHWRKHGDNVTSLHRAAVLEGLYRCALEFVDRHQGESHFPAISPMEIQHEWERSEALRAFFEGRRLLVGKRWPEARARFQAAWPSPDWRVRAAALCGVAASYLQFDLEPLMRMAGRADPAPWEV